MSASSWQFDFDLPKISQPQSRIPREEIYLRFFSNNKEIIYERSGGVASE